ncbi:hypothetical protein Taro_031229 [Colocasia esculenta]|uniref:Dof zinc finger protein n=1 Tax=Colocasia esculenta TaxID=4460 RepID=A0A843W5R0_COLES|nr:hypothetical protein [Colocasia esculenta]
MQDPEEAAALQAAVSRAPQLPQEEQNLRCPRCDSTNTKFCYYNNYNLSQPRHFCKSCRRYWTKGGALRNIPIGGGTRKSSKRTAPASSSFAVPHPKRAHTSSSPRAAAAGGRGPFTVEPLPALYPPVDADRRMLDITGSFTSLLASSGHFVSLLDSFHAGLPPGALGRPSAADSGCRPPCSSSLLLHSPSSDSGTRTATATPPPSQPQQPPMLENFLGLQGEPPGCWNGSSGWPDLTVYTPGSSFQ